MKATAKKKSSMPVKGPAKTANKTPAKPGAKPAVKASAKAAAAPRATPKPDPKAGVKPASKPASKVVPKPVLKAALKPTRPPLKSASPVIKKPAPGKIVKTATQAVAKAAVKSSATAAPKKAAVIPAKPATAKAVIAVKPAKPETKLVTKTIPKSSAKPEVKFTAKTAVKAADKAAEKTAGPALQAPIAPPARLPTPMAIQSNGLLPRPPLKPGRRSSARIASQSPPPAPMVPTHSPDAAKASYSVMTERVIAPPPQAAAKKDPKLANNWKSKSAEALTDDEVKAMPDAEYMNEKQMAFFRHKLSLLKQDIHNSAGETTEHLREDTVVVPDPADRATIEEEHALELRTRDRERKLLKKIEQSIARIDSGDYGYCDETGEAIGVGRLIARPTANLSLEAQQRRELKQKMFGD